MMKDFGNELYQKLSLIALFILLISYAGIESLTIQMHDTYIVVAIKHFAYLLSFVLTVNALIFYFLRDFDFQKRKLKSYLFLVLFSVGLQIGVTVISFTKYLPVSNDIILLIFAISLVLTQVAFVILMLNGVTKKKTQS